MKRCFTSREKECLNCERLEATYDEIDGFPRFVCELDKVLLDLDKEHCYDFVERVKNGNQKQD